MPSPSKSTFRAGYWLLAPKSQKVVGSGRVVVVTVGVIQVGVPVSVDAGVSGGGLQLGGGLAHAIGSGAEDIGIPVAVGDGAAVVPNQPADTAEVAAYAAGGVAGGDGAAAAVAPNQPADIVVAAYPLPVA